MDTTYLITTENPMMNLIGLSSFTFRDLENWVRENNGNNLQYLDIVSKDGVTANQINDLSNRTPVFNMMREILYGTLGTPRLSFKTFRNDPSGDQSKTTTFELTGDDESWEYTSSDDEDYQLSDLDLDTLSTSLNTGSATVYSDEYAYLFVYINQLINHTNYTVDDANNARKALFEDMEIGGSVIEWVNPILIHTNKTDTCVHQVKFKIQLYSQAKPRKPKIQVTIPDPIFTEEETIFDEENRPTGTQKVSRRYNPGTKMVYGKLLHDLASVSDDFDTDNDPLPTGQAELIRDVEDNPYHIAPVFKFADCEENTSDEQEEKEKILVRNALNSDFKKDRRYVFAQIQNSRYWQPMAFGSGVTAPTLATTEVSSWEFTYMVSCANDFFRDSSNNSVSYTAYEAALHDMYYNGTASDLLNHRENGYVQLTSFDFMGASIGGLRTTHALGNTQFGKDIDGNDIADPHTSHSRRTTPFFGCVFPDGYQLGSKYAEYNLPLGTAAFASGNYAAYMQGSLAGPLFTLGENQETNGVHFQANDANVIQLPADIALNADPASTIGGPVTIMKRMENYFSNPDPVGIRSEITDYLKNENSSRWACMFRGDNKEPLFEFEPVNSKIVQFRPLKAEVYASFEVWDSSVKTTNEDEKGVFGTIAWNRVNPATTEPPVSRTVLSDARIGGNGGVVTGASELVRNLRYNDQVELNLPSANSAFPLEYWRLGIWQASGPRPAGAVGIIGAKCTVTANTAITFTAQCNYGMNDYIVSNFWNSSYGGFSSTYDSLNNTMLYARIFHAWPRELTVFDPRFFTVHHFAPLPGIDYRENLEYEEINNNDDPDDDTNAYKVGKYRTYSVVNSITDKKAPTLVDDGNNGYTGKVADADTYVFANEDSDDPVWRDQGDWLIDIQNRGNLLPTENTRRTIGLSYDTTAMVIEDGGQDYLNGNTFTTKGGSGSGVLISIVGLSDGAGGVVQQDNLQIEYRGMEFEPKDFFKESEELSWTYAGATVKLDPINANGKGLKVFFPYGQVYDVLNKIDKPSTIDANNQHRLSETAPVPVRDQSSKTNSAMNKTKTTTVNIGTKSDDNKYDIFMHYHNDISHVFDNQWVGYSVNSHEQAIQLEITPF